MKKMQQILSICLVVFLFIPGTFAFAATVSSEDGMTYAEKMLDVPEGYDRISAISSVLGGGAAMLAQKGEQNDVLLWNTAHEMQTISLPLQNIISDYISVAPDGRIAVLFMEMPEGMQNGGSAREEMPSAEDEPPQRIEKSEAPDAEGSALKQQVFIGMESTVAWFDQAGAEIARFAYNDIAMGMAALDGQKTVVFSPMKGISILDEKGSIIAEISESEPILSFCAAEDSLMVLTTESITSYQTDSGSKIASVPVRANYNAKLVAKADGNLLLMDANGLFHISPETGEMDLLMNATGNLFGDPTNATLGLAVLTDGTLMALFEEGTGGGNAVTIRMGVHSSSVLAAYTPVSTADVAEKTDFTITALYDSTKLRKAASLFQRSHPELNVVLQTALAQGDEAPADDHIRTINTNLLAGKGGDVLILDGLPIRQYAQRGILADLSAILADTALLPGIREGSTDAEGRIYAVPAQFSFDLVWGNEAVVSAIQELSTLADLPIASGQTLMSPRMPEDWLRLFYAANAPLFTDAEGKPDFESPAFVAFLEALQLLYAQQGEMPSDLLQVMGDIAHADLIAMMNGATALYPASINNLMLLNIAYTISGEKDSAFAPIPTLDGMGRSYQPALLAGICTQSAQPELAQEFIATLLSPEIQETEEMEGLPTISDSLDVLFAAAIERTNNAGNLKMMFSMDGTNPIEMGQPSEDVLNRLRSLCDTLNTPGTMDETLLRFMVEETEAFFAGSISGEDAARAVRQRAWPYLNE